MLKLVNYIEKVGNTNTNIKHTEYYEKLLEYYENVLIEDENAIIQKIYDRNEYILCYKRGSSQENTHKEKPYDWFYVYSNLDRPKVDYIGSTETNKNFLDVYVDTLKNNSCYLERLDEDGLDEDGRKFDEAFKAAIKCELER